MIRTLTSLLRRSWSCHPSHPPLPLPLFSPTIRAFSLPTPFPSLPALIFSLTLSRCTVLGRYAVHAHFQPIAHRTTISTTTHHVARRGEEARRVRYTADRRRPRRRNGGGACSPYSLMVHSFTHSGSIALHRSLFRSVIYVHAAMLSAARHDQGPHAAVQIWTCPRGESLSLLLYLPAPSFPICYVAG